MSNIKALSFLKMEKNKMIYVIVSMSCITHVVYCFLIKLVSLGTIKTTKRLKSNEILLLKFY